jgi:anti-sigma B factor antagonist
MGESKLRVEERDAGDVTMLILAGEMLLDDGDLVFRKVIHDHVEKGRVKILVDLAGVTYIDSSGVGMMAAKLKTVRDSGGDIRLMHLTTRGQRLLSLLKLRSTFETFEDETLALRSFERRPRGL